MPDKAKIQFESGCYYHVYNHGNSNDDLFMEEENYHFFLRRLHFFIDESTILYAWCLLPNHFHLLVKVKEKYLNPEGEIIIPDHKLVSEQLRHFFTSYSKAFNKRYSRRGTLFLRSFHRKKITDDNYLKNIIRYIHLNPVNHGFVYKPDEWKHSSYKSIIDFFHEGTGEEIIRYFGGMEEFIDFHRVDFGDKQLLTGADLKDFKNL